jgi:hypothetical protein
MDGLAVFDRTINMSQAMVRRDAQAVVMIVTDNRFLARSVETVCDFLGLGVEVVPTRVEVSSLLNEYHPMAVIVEVDGVAQDGYHVMMEVAIYDSELPIMLLTGDDPALMGAADAVQEICGLTSVTKAPELPHAGALVDFLFKAGRQAGCSRLMPV